MYTKINGEKINGEVLSRFTRTMTVRADDGYVYVCKLVGEPAPLKTFSIMPSKPGVFDGVKQPRCRVIKPNGQYRDFDSVGIAADHYRTDRSTASRNCNSDKPLARGRLKGYKFDRIV